MIANRILREHFERKKRVGYSMRALARDLDVSPTFVSNMFSGKKRVPLTLIGPMARILDIDSETVLELKRQLLPADPFASSGKAPSATNRWQVDGKKSLLALRQWFYLPIMEMTLCDGFDGLPATIARRLNLSLTSVEIAVRELLSLGLVSLQEGRIMKTTAMLRLSSAQSQHEIRNFHRQMLKRAELELDDTSVEAFARRLITGITVTADPEKIAIAKKMLSDSLHEIAGFLADGKGSEVYHLAAQLFPLTIKK